MKFPEYMDRGPRIGAGREHPNSVLSSRKRPEPGHDAASNARDSARAQDRSLTSAGLGVVLLALFAGLTSIALRDRWFGAAMDRHIAGFCDWVLPANLNAVSKVLAGFGSVVP